MTRALSALSQQRFVLRLRQLKGRGNQLQRRRQDQRRQTQR
ncbi:MAG: hypothetical protein ACFCBW_04775 [Candidatus Competibacterales bacterium]